MDLISRQAAIDAIDKKEDVEWLKQIDKDAGTEAGK